MSNKMKINEGFAVFRKGIYGTYREDCKGIFYSNARKIDV